MKRTLSIPGIAGFAFALVALSCVPGMAGETPKVAARHDLSLASEAAHAWSSDAYLIYVENDESLDAAGRSQRWGFLYYSPTKDQARGYSVGDGKIVQAGDLGFDFPAPPVREDFIDSAEAYSTAQSNAGQKYCETWAGHLRSMLLLRGAFHEKNPDATTWTLVYDSPRAPSLWVVVDAGTGKVVRTWKG